MSGKVREFDHDWRVATLDKIEREKCLTHLCPKYPDVALAISAVGSEKWSDQCCSGWLAACVLRACYGEWSARPSVADAGQSVVSV